MKLKRALLTTSIFVGTLGFQLSHSAATPSGSSVRVAYFSNRVSAAVFREPPVLPATTPVVAKTSPTGGSSAGFGNGNMFKATCYALRGPTASGRPAGPGVIAVDPNIIKLGTRVNVEGYGVAVAGDTGGAIKGYRIDIWKPTSAECVRWGVKTVKVTPV